MGAKKPLGRWAGYEILPDGQAGLPWTHSSARPAPKTRSLVGRDLKPPSQQAGHPPRPVCRPFPSSERAGDLLVA